MFSGVHHPLNTILILAAVGLIPFVMMVATSFIKFSIVLGLVRNALGVQQIPPNMALYAISLLMTVYVMYPVGVEVAELAIKYEVGMDDFDNLRKALPHILEPYRLFLVNHTTPANVQFFIEQATLLWPEKYATDATDQSLLILIPAFLIEEMTEAFQMGFLLYLPFVVVDLIVSNILLALGMMMVAPMTISLPFKLLLFVIVDGWTRITESLLLSYMT